MNMDVNMFIAMCYQAYSEAVNRDGFFGVKPKQEYIDLFWNSEITPRIQAKFDKAMKELEAQQGNNEKLETKTNKKDKGAK